MSKEILNTETHRQCSNCKMMFQKTLTDTMRICNTCNTARVKCLSAEYKMYNRAQQRSKKSGLEFTIERSDIQIPKNCPILGIPLVSHKGSAGGKNNSPSLDRIDSSKGYTKDNIMVVSHLGNMMKSVATSEELIKFAEWVFKTYKLDGNNEPI